MADAKHSGSGMDGGGFVSTSPFGKKYTFDQSKSSSKAEIDEFLSDGNEGGLD